MKIWILTVALVLSLSANIMLICNETNLGGGGQIEDSPNNELTANAIVKQIGNPFFPGSVKDFAYFTISKRYDLEPLVTLKLWPTKEHTYRGLPAGIIKWADDSSSVTFKIPEGKLTLNAPHDR